MGAHTQHILRKGEAAMYLRQPARAAYHNTMRTMAVEPAEQNRQLVPAIAMPIQANDVPACTSCLASLLGSLAMHRYLNQTLQAIGRQGCRAAVVCVSKAEARPSALVASTGHVKCKLLPLQVYKFSCSPCFLAAKSGAEKAGVESRMRLVTLRFRFRRFNAVLLAVAFWLASRQLWSKEWRACATAAAAK